MSKSKKKIKAGYRNTTMYIRDDLWEKYKNFCSHELKTTLAINMILQAYFDQQELKEGKDV